ncbi:WSC domain protein [Ceratobasidium sp. AG-Ba]|nr:WSC domain protein [Ceratobasidium sp. AG-Ba]
MISFSRALAAGALLASAVHAGDNFIQTQVRTLEYSRVDPLVNPGANGEHVHTVVGGSAFSPTSTTHDSLANSKCSSSSLQDDKSAYWSPSLYYVHSNGSYSLIPSSTRIYYFLKPGNGTTPVKAFPKGHRMLAGPPSNKRPNPPPPRGKLSYDQLQAMDPRVAAIKWGCSAGAVQGQGNGGSMDGQRPYLPNDAPNGCGVVNAGIFYPSCSDGRLDSPDHFDHMRYPLDGSNGYNCPPSHPIKYPTIFMEHFYFPKADQPYRGANRGNWILSSGDRIGTSFHADFIEGWSNNALDDALASCNTPDAPGDNLSACQALGRSVSVDAANNCRSEGDIVYEDVGLVRAIESLPGCNVWPDDQDTHPGCKNGQTQMGQPAGRYVLDEFKLALPIAAQEGSGGKAKVDSSSSSASSTSTSSAAPTTTATTTSATSSSSASSTSTSSAAPTTTATTTSATSSSSSSASATTTSSYTDDYNYGAAPPSGSSTSTSSSSSGVPTSTSSVSTDDYNYGAAPPAGATGTSTSSSSAAPTSSGSTDDYNYGAAPPAPAGTSTSSSAVPTPTATQSADDYNFGAPAPGPAGNSNPATTATASSSVVPTSVQPTSPSTTPVPQQANAPAPNKPKKTCRPKHKGKGKGKTHSRRKWQSRLIN